MNSSTMSVTDYMQPSPRRGKWKLIHLADDEDGKPIYAEECSLCGGHCWHTKYCPHCGALMEDSNETD